MVTLADQVSWESSFVRNGKSGGWAPIRISLSLALFNMDSCSNNMLYPREDKINKQLMYAVSGYCHDSLCVIR